MLPRLCDEKQALASGRKTIGNVCTRMSAQYGIMIDYYRKKCQFHTYYLLSIRMKEWGWKNNQIRNVNLDIVLEKKNEGKQSICRS